MESERYTNLSIYSQKGGKKLSSKKTTYIPSSNNDNSINKLFKENRLLHSRIEELETLLEEEKQKNSKLSKELKALKL